MESYSLLIAIVRSGYSESAMLAATEAGAKGGTVINARGTGNLDMTKFLGAPIEPEREIILVLTDKESKKDIMKAIHKAAGLTTEGKGVIFSLPVEDVVGSFRLTNGDK